MDKWFSSNDTILENHKISLLSIMQDQGDRFTQICLSLTKKYNEELIKVKTEYESKILLLECENEKLKIRVEMLEFKLEHSK